MIHGTMPNPPAAPSDAVLAQHAIDKCALNRWTFSLEGLCPIARHFRGEISARVPAGVIGRTRPVRVPF